MEEPTAPSTVPPSLPSPHVREHKCPDPFPFALLSHPQDDVEQQQRQTRACPWKQCDVLEEAVARLSCLRLSGAHQREGCEWMLAREFAQRTEARATTPTTKRAEQEAAGGGGEGEEKDAKRSREPPPPPPGKLLCAMELEPQETSPPVDPEVAKREDVRRRKNESKRRQRARKRMMNSSAGDGSPPSPASTTVPVDHYLGVRGGILADSVGLGKTFIAMAVVAVNSKRRTLIVTLPSTTIQWCDAIYSFSGMVPSSVLNSRMEAIPEVCSSDVIVTTYCCIRERPPWAMREHWDRIILDEGHVVRNPKTATYAALSMLRADIRWVLSATPIHNGDVDMKTLLRWVGARPDVTPLPQLVSHLVLRRTMETEKHRTPSLNLPPLTVENVEIDLREEELQLYKKIEDEARREKEEDEQEQEQEKKQDAEGGGEGKGKDEGDGEGNGKGNGNGDGHDTKNDNAAVEGQERGGEEKDGEATAAAAAEGQHPPGLTPPPPLPSPLSPVRATLARRKRSEPEKEDNTNCNSNSKNSKRKKRGGASSPAGSLSASAGGMLRRIGQMRQLCISPEVMVRARQARERQELVPSNFEDDDDDDSACIHRLAELERGMSSKGFFVPPAVVSSLTDDREARALLMPMMPPPMKGGEGNDDDTTSKPPPRQRLRLLSEANNNTTIPSSPASIDPMLSAADIIARLEDARAPDAPASNLSSKMSRLCDMVCADLRADPSVKIVVFTTFLAEMDIIARELGGPRRVSCTRIHGGMSPLQRGPSIDMFSCPHSGTSVLLAQIMCMSTGVNLQCASIAYITSPSWNPCIEEQAIGRLHRQGQARPVTVRRLIVRDSIETRCMQVQARKLDIIRSNVNASAAAAPPASPLSGDGSEKEKEKEKERERRRTQAALTALAARGGNGDGNNNTMCNAEERKEGPGMTAADEALHKSLADVEAERRAEAKKRAEAEAEAASAAKLTEGDIRHLLFGDAPPPEPA